MGFTASLEAHHWSMTGAGWLKPFLLKSGSRLAWTALWIVRPTASVGRASTLVLSALVLSAELAGKGLGS